MAAATAPRSAAAPRSSTGPGRVPLVAGNWKQNTTAAQALHLVQKLAWTLRDARFDPGATEVVVLPPTPWLRSVQTLLERDAVSVALGAQDVSVFDGGAHTGEVSAAMLADAGCRFVTVGHSERRREQHEDDEVVATKVRRALGAGLTPILCVGEPREVRDAGGALDHVGAQVRHALAAGEGRDAVAVADVVVAYEPIWAIGSGTAATPDDAQEVCQAIRATLADLSDTRTSGGVRVLYGGSVTSRSAAHLMDAPDVDGALVGGASLDPVDFAGICRYRDLPRV